jgi:hypothetical protein
MVQRFVPRGVMLGAQTSKRPRGQLVTLLEDYYFVEKLGSSFHNVFSQVDVVISASLVGQQKQLRGAMS